jgi:hypothetical protein
MGDAAIRQMNIYHEFGHLIDSLPGVMYDQFTDDLIRQGSPSYIGSNGYLNPDALFDQADAIQASNNGKPEQWADIFANYVAGNIDLTKGAGKDMYRFVINALAPYTGLPVPSSPPIIPSTAN